MKTKHEELIDFRAQAKVAVSREELRELSLDVHRQKSDLGKEVAEIYFEQKCLDQFQAMLCHLKEAGYTELLVIPWKSASWGDGSELRAYPKLGARAAKAPLWEICKKYFYETTSCGGTADSDMISLATKFPNDLLGTHIL